MDLKVSWELVAMSATADRSAGTPARIVSQVCNFQYFARKGVGGGGVERKICMETIPNRWEYDKFINFGYR